MIKKLSILIFLGLNISQAAGTNDKDFDGVPDSIDECQNTPFLAEVNKLGCVVNTLTLPFETEKESLLFSIGYGFSTNEDLIDREVQNNTKVKINYYLNGWGYSLQTGYYSHSQHEGTLDTILKVRKRMKINSNFSLTLGTGVRLPSYEFDGNKVDALFYTSLHYYPTESLSFFAGYNYTYIGDDEVDTVLSETPSGDEDKDGDEGYEPYLGLQNTHNYYVGAGYFFTDSIYMNLSYSDVNSKFVSEHNIRTISTSLYYKINKKWFTTLYYKHEVFDEDLHNNLLFSVGYHIW